MCTIIPLSLFADQDAFIYMNEEAVSKHDFQWGKQVGEEIFIPSGAAPLPEKQIFLGFLDGTLYSSSLSRIDYDSRIAVLKKGPPVGNSKLQSQHQSFALRLAEAYFQPSVSAPIAGQIDTNYSSPVVPQQIESSSYVLKINGQNLDGQVKLKNVFRKSKFELEVVHNSSAPIWNIFMEISAAPKLSFWKPGRHTSLNEVPRPIYRQDHQFMFKSFQKGQSYKFSLEAHFIAEKEYVFHIKIGSNKDVLIERDVQVEFE
jgi:hypothetical protein